MLEEKKYTCMKCGAPYERLAIDWTAVPGQTGASKKGNGRAE